MDSLFENKITLSKKTQLVKHPTKIKPVPPKPYLMDIAGDYVNYPNLEEKVKEKKGWFGGLFG